MKRTCRFRGFKRGDPREIDVSLFNTEGETWVRCARNFDYAVSSLGRIASLHEFNFGKLITTWADRHGYHHVHLAGRGGRGKRTPIHVLVCESFHGQKPDWADVVAHGDGNRANNVRDNLRWATNQENQLDRRRHGTSRPKFLRLSIPA